MEQITEYQKVSPELARQWLDTRQLHYQRPVTIGHIRKLTQLMLDGLWNPRVSPITFAERNGRLLLLNGQHRLNAIIEYGKPVECWILVQSYNTDQEVDEVYAATDVLRLRTPGQGLLVFGTHELLGLSANEVKKVGQAIRVIGKSFFPDSNNTLYYGYMNTAKEQHEAILKWQTTIDCLFGILEVASSRMRQLLLGTYTLAIMLVTLRYDTERAIEFWRQVADNQGLRKGEPAYALVQYMTQKHKYTRQHYAIGVARAWNAHVADQHPAFVQGILNTEGMLISNTPFNGKLTGRFDFDTKVK